MLVKITKIFIFALLMQSLAPNAHALKSRTPAPKKSSAAPGTTSAAGSYSTARLSRPTNSVIINFRNLNAATKASYELSYTARGIQQGAMGSINVAGDTDTRDLYFGTCSHGVCTPHSNIKNATLTVRVNLKNGRTNTKRYRIKV